MTHSCPCGHDWFDNKAGGDCPKCGNDRNIGHFFDELPEEPEEDETYSQQMQDELEPIDESHERSDNLKLDKYYKSYPNHLPRLIKEMEDEGH